MMAHISEIDTDELRSKVETHFQSKKINIGALLNAMNVNEVKSYEADDQRRFLSKQQATVKKLDPWLEKIKKKQIWSPDIIQEKDRIQVLDSVTTNEVVTNIDKYIAKRKNK